EDHRFPGLERKGDLGNGPGAGGSTGHDHVTGKDIDVVPGIVHVGHDRDIYIARCTCVRTGEDADRDASRDGFRATTHGLHDTRSASTAENDPPVPRQQNSQPARVRYIPPRCLSRADHSDDALANPIPHGPYLNTVCQARPARTMDLSSLSRIAYAAC